jgi:hypothetical protein
MCWKCDHPEASHQDYVDYMCDKIAQFGWAIQGVERDGVHPPWAYTVGLTLYDLPELVITGMSLRQSARLLNEMAEHTLHCPTPRPAPGEQIPWRDGPLLEVVWIEEPTAHLNLAVELFGPQVRALQLVHADDHEHWPWDSWYRGVRGGQPVLGMREPEPGRGRRSA